MSWDYEPLVGVPHHSEIRVRRRWTVPDVLPGSTLAARGEPVMATGYLIVVLENATWQVVDPYVPDHLALLGHTGHYQHTGPATQGEILDVTVTCTGGYGSHTWWQTSAHIRKTAEQVGVLSHTLVTSRRDRFHARLLRSL